MLALREALDEGSGLAVDMMQEVWAVCEREPGVWRRRDDEGLGAVSGQEQVRSVHWPYL